MCVFWVHFQLVETVRRSISSGGQFAADEAGESGPPEDLPEKHWTGTVQLENCVWASVSAFESVPKFHLHPGTFNVLRLSHVVCVCVCFSNLCACVRLDTDTGRSEILFVNGDMDSGIYAHRFESYSQVFSLDLLRRSDRLIEYHRFCETSHTTNDCFNSMFFFFLS